MPLSDHEQRLLEQMERALYAEDPKFATSMRNPRNLTGDRHRVAIGVLALLVGMGALVAGVATQLAPVGVLGFLVMLGGLWLAVAAFRAAPAPMAHPSAPNNVRQIGQGRSARQKRRSTGASLSDRMQERWQRRRDTGDF
jgi:hypothetical protein